MLFDRASDAKISLLTLASLMVLIGAAGRSEIGWAAPDGDDYLQALKIANAKIERTQQRVAHPGTGRAAVIASALTSAMPERLSLKPYQVGETWEVAAWQADPTAMRMTSDPRHLESGKGRVGIFKYRVAEVKESPTRQVVFEITQRDAHGQTVVDPQVDRITLTMNETYEQARKSYAMKNHPDPIHVAPSGLRSAMTRLELFPLDIPEVITAEASQPKSLPELPEALREIARQSEFKPDLGRSVWYSQDDFFGRGIDILWQLNDPWPAYIKTSQGVSILISRGGS